MALFRRGRHGRSFAVVVSAVMVVVGMGGATYAVAQITGADIKDGTVKSTDIKNHTLKLKDFSLGATSGLVGPKGDPGQVGPKGDPGQVGPSDAYSTSKPIDTSLTGSFAPVVSLVLPAGNYTASVTGIVFAANSGATFANCLLKFSGNAAFGESATTIPAGGTYASVAAQATFSAGAETTLTFSCRGSSAGINKVTLTAIHVGSLHTS